VIGAQRIDGDQHHRRILETHLLASATRSERDDAEQTDA
jgi:hypothetical protein